MAGEAMPGSDGHVSIRPEQFTLSQPGNGAILEGIVDRLIYLGTDSQHLIRLSSGTEILTRSKNVQHGSGEFAPGDAVGLHVNPGAARLLVD